MTERDFYGIYVLDVKKRRAKMERQFEDAKREREDRIVMRVFKIGGLVWIAIMSVSIAVDVFYPLGLEIPISLGVLIGSAVLVFVGMMLIYQFDGRG